MARKRPDNLDEAVLTPSDCRMARAALLWSQAELAERSGISRVTVARFEQSEQLPGKAALTDLRAIFERAGIVFADDEAGYRAIINTDRWIVVLSADFCAIEIGDRISVLEGENQSLQCADMKRSKVATAATRPASGRWAHNYARAGDSGIVTKIESSDDKTYGKTVEITYRPASPMHFSVSAHDCSSGA